MKLVARMAREVLFGELDREQRRKQWAAPGLVGCGSSRASLPVEVPPLRLHSCLVAAVSISFEHLLEGKWDLGDDGYRECGVNSLGQPMAFSHSDS